MLLFVARPVGAEEITRYDASYEIDDHGSIDVRELIVVDFGSDERHGIVRSIPLQYTRGEEPYVVRLSRLALTDSVGLPRDFTVTREGDGLVVRVGSDDEVVSGEQNYVFNYTLDGAIGYGDAVDEFVWGVVSADWSMPISDVRVHIGLPEPIGRTQLDVRCVAGAHGSTDVCDDVQADDRGDGTTANVLVSHASLAPAEGVTVALIVPKGTIATPRPLSVVLHVIIDFRYWFIGGLILLFFVVFAVKMRFPHKTNETSG